MINYLLDCYLSKIQNAALATGLVTKERAEDFHTSNQVLALRTCMFTPEQALNVNNKYPVVAAIAHMVEHNDYFGVLRTIWGGSCLNLDEGIKFIYKDFDTEEALDYTSVFQLKISGCESHKNSLKITNLIQYTAYSFNSISADNAAKFEKWSQVYKFDQSDSLQEALTVTEEFGWFDFTTKIAPNMIKWAYNDLMGEDCPIIES